VKGAVASRTRDHDPSRRRPAVVRSWSCRRECRPQGAKEHEHRVRPDHVILSPMSTAAWTRSWTRPPISSGGLGWGEHSSGEIAIACDVAPSWRSDASGCWRRVEERYRHGRTRFGRVAGSHGNERRVRGLRAGLENLAPVVCAIGVDSDRAGQCAGVVFLHPFGDSCRVVDTQDRPLHVSSVSDSVPSRGDGGIIGPQQRAQHRPGRRKNTSRKEAKPCPSCSDCRHT
jgi:hypothetical protein